MRVDTPNLTLRPRSLRDHTKLMFVVSILIILAGCATTASVKQIDRLDAVGDNPTILIMTPNVKYFSITLSGVTQPHAEWTKAARQNFTDSLQAYADERNIKTIVLGKGQFDDVEVAYQKLYPAVGASILIHHFGVMKLPTKKALFDWSLGPGVQAIADKYGAEYALFIYYRDHQATGARVAFAALAAVAGVDLPTGQEFGFASLVDLRNGNIVWFKQVAAGLGELREASGAKAMIDALFKDLPQS